MITNKLISDLYLCKTQDRSNKWSGHWHHCEEPTVCDRLHVIQPHQHLNLLLSFQFCKLNSSNHIYEESISSRYIIEWSKFCVLFQWTTLCDACPSSLSSQPPAWLPQWQTQPNLLTHTLHPPHPSSYPSPPPTTPWPSPDKISEDHPPASSP